MQTTNHLAQITNPALTDAMQNILASDNPILFFQLMIPSLIAFIFVVGTLVFFGMLVFGGIQWMTAGGDKAALEGARGKVVSSLIGLFILFSSYVIIKLFELLFGINIIELDLGFLFIG
jgi:hypothetical protein